MIVHDIVRQRQLDTLLAREAGRPLRGGTNALPPDYVDGATISARAMRAAVLTTAGLVLRAHPARTAPTAAPAVTAAAAPTGVTAAPVVTTVIVPTLDLSFSIKPWDDLVGRAPSCSGGHFGRGGDGLADAGATGPGSTGARRGRRSHIEFMTALATPPAIGGNLLGLLKFEDYKRELPRGAQAIFVASNGPYDFLGTKYFR